jgi:hypothetical protein
MKKIYGKHLRAEFEAAMERHFPPFEPFRPRLTKAQRETLTPFSGERFFRWRVRDDLYGFIVLTPHPRHERFDIAAGWSTGGAYPFNSPLTPPEPDAGAFELPEYLASFSTLYRYHHGTYAPPHPGWSVWECSVPIDHPDYLRIAGEEDAEPVSERQAADRAREAVRKAIADIRQVVIPYLEARVSWDSPAAVARRAAGPDAFDRAKDEFGVRFYRWALADARREVEAGFPLLATIKGRLAQAFLANAGTLSPPDRLRLAIACVKNAHRRAAALAGESLSEEERALGRAYVAAIPRIELPEERARRGPQGSHWSRPWDRSGLLALVRSELAPRLGAGIEPPGRPHAWRWDSRVGRWTVRTLVDVSSFWPCVACFHSIDEADAEPRRLVDGTGILEWLGIALRTWWDLLLDGDLPEAARSVRLVSEHFLAAVPDLLEGLDPSGRAR